MSETCRVVAIGGGYASAYLLKALRPIIRSGKVQLTVIDRNNYHVFHGLVAEMLMGKVQLPNIISPSRTLFRGADFHNGEVESVDFEERTVVTRQFLSGRKVSVPYDHLVIGLGSTDDLSRYRGLSENAFSLKTYWGVFELKNHIVQVFELAEIETDVIEKTRLLTFVIAGANYAGIEVATELDEFVEVLTKSHYHNISYSDVRIIVINAEESILSEMGEKFPRLSRYAQRYLENSHIQFRHNTKLKSATPYEAVTSSGDVIPTHTIISCTGNAQSILFDSWKLPRDKNGQLLTNEFCQVEGEQSVWSAGDCASVPHPKGGRCPPLAIYAMTQGQCIGKNIARIVKGKAKTPYKFTGLGDACSLARRKAVGQLWGIQLTGFSAWLVWRLFMLIYLPVMNRRVRTFLDWIIWPFVGREIVSIRADKPVSVRVLYFEADQVILKQGDEGNGMYLISEGQVQIEEDGQPVAVRKEGEHFGDIAIFKDCMRTATVRALTHVKLIELKRGLAMLMKPTLQSRDKPHE